MNGRMAIVGLIALGLGTVWWLRAPGPFDGHAPVRNALASIDVVGRTPGESATALEQRNPGQTPGASAQPRSPAWQTMADAREHGDDRAPPIDRPTPDSQAPAPTTWELSDPRRYRDYERRGQQRLRAEYLMAAEEELPKWKAMLAQMRANGAPPAAIAEAEEKIRHLEARQVALRNDASAH